MTDLLTHARHRRKDVVYAETLCGGEGYLFGTIYANALLWKRLYLDIFMGTVRLTAYRTLLVYFYVLRLGYSSIGKESTRD